MKKNLLLLSAVMFVVSSVFLTIESVTSGAEIASLEKKEVGLINQKRQLEEDLVKAISVSDLEERSISLGYQKPSNVVYLGEGDTVASLSR